MPDDDYLYFRATWGWAWLAAGDIFGEIAVASDELARVCVCVCVRVPGFWGGTLCVARGMFSPGDFGGTNGDLVLRLLR